MIMQSNAIEVRVTEPSATVLLNRPERCNALSRAMIGELRDSLRDLYQEKRVKAVILTGAGDFFCSGQDIKELATTNQHAPQEDHQQWGQDASDFRDLIQEMLELPKPLIASINGPALGSGAGLALACDITIASPNAGLGIPDPRRGLVSGVVAPLLAYRLGAGPAGRLLLTAETVDADEAHRLGVYHEIVKKDLLWARAAEIGKQCSTGAAEAISLTKRLLLETAGERLATQLTSGAIATASSRTTEAAQEGLVAFLEKREPSWDQ